MRKLIFAAVVSIGVLAGLHAATRTTAEATDAWEWCKTDGDCNNGEICCHLCGRSDPQCIAPDPAGRCPVLPCAAE